jgi:ribonuclease-3
LGVFLRALDDLITEEDKTELGTQLGGDVFAKLMDLHYSVHRSDVALRSEKDFIDSSSIVGRPVSGFSISSWKANVPAFAQFTTFPFIPSSITAWKLEEIPKTLPPLPEILDPTLETSAFTHIGVGGGRAIDLNYERLEFLGDSFIHLLSSLFISKTFPHFTPGKSSQLRQRLIQNTQLCQYSHQYNFGARARFPAGFLGSATDQEKIFADIFEAYIAAVILSDPAHGLERATQWLKGIWGRTIIRDIRAEGKKGAEFDSPIWNLRGRDATIEIVSSSQAPLNAKEELQKKLQSKDAKIKYEDLGPERYNKVTKQPLFTVGVYMDGYGERKQLGWGTATGKKDAGMKAAEMALKNGALMKYYVDKKNLQAKMDQQEAEALAEM